METLKKILTSNRAKTLYWQIAVGIIGLAIAYIGELNIPESAILVALLNMASKYINQTYL